MTDPEAEAGSGTVEVAGWKDKGLGGWRRLVREWLKPRPQEVSLEEEEGRSTEGWEMASQVWSHFASLAFTVVKQNKPSLPTSDIRFPSMGAVSSTLMSEI